MEARQIDGTDVSVSRIGFGTASLHHQFSKRSRLHLLETALSSGITHFDTSPFYGLGLAEVDIGQFARGKRDRLTLTTKIGLYSPEAFPSSISVWARKGLGQFSTTFTKPVIDWRLDRAKKSLDLSLRRLSCEYVDFLLLHEPELTAIDSDEFLGWLSLLKQQGKIRQWGIAGVTDTVSTWTKAQHPLATVVQTRDSAEGLEANFLPEIGRVLQFTYGYLSGLAAHQHADTVVLAALKRNQRGCILVSTRHASRIMKLAEAVK